MTPRLWILAGPNGSGKSSFVNTDIFETLTNTPEHPDVLLRLNPDQMALTLARERPDLKGDALSLEAAIRSDAKLDEMIAQRKSLLVETVLSSDKLIARVERAAAGGYWIGFVFLLLRHPDLNVKRVAARVVQGGHDVPEDRIRHRWERSIARLPVFAGKATAFWVFDNSVKGGPMTLLIERAGETRYVSDLARAIVTDLSIQAALRDALNQTIRLL